MKMKCKIFTVAALVTVAAAALYSQSITATKAYVDRRYADAMNAVPSIVTNEAVEFTEWVPSPDTYNGYPVTFRMDVSDDGKDYLLFFVGGNIADAVPIDASTSTSAYSSMISVIATRSCFTRNALGLARLKDLEKLPTHEDVTNTARDVVNTVWDAKLGVAWEARMYDGHLYYIAVTNVQEVAK